KKALPELGIRVELSKVNLPQVQFTYSETPNAALLGLADDILNDLAKLSDKIIRFIKQNNSYGTTYQKKPKKKYKADGNKDFVGDLNRCSEQLSAVLQRNYVVDLFSDGSEELQEMLRVLWRAVEVIMAAPVLTKRKDYTFSDGSTAVDGEINKAISGRIVGRYAQIDAALNAEDFLADKSEEALFDIYIKMSDLVATGRLVNNKANPAHSKENGKGGDAMPAHKGDSEQKLEQMIGLHGIRENIKKIKAYALANNDSKDLNIHMCFLGNPGSGKTEVARILADILYENQILPTRKIVEVDRSGLVSMYFGATAEKTSRVIESAMGGVLFIDEAYALGNNSDIGITDYGKEAIDTLVKAMEDHRGKFCVILAGYKNEMLQMLSTNPGFKSRIQFTLDFPNYSRDELQSIADLMLKRRHYTIGEAAMNKILDITDVKRKEPNFANAREVRNILDQVIMCQNIRCVGTEDKEIGIADVNRYIKDEKINLPTTGEGFRKKIMTGEEELDQLIGLDAVKRMIKKIKAYGKRNKGEAGFNLHMCFYGNPGTGKTEVARILSRVLYDAGVLDEAKLVETDGQGLLGKFVGETAPKTEGLINDAMGGVLFIDEAYSLMGRESADGGATNYGSEAIAVLLKEMEDHRGQFCAILAGYKDEIKKLLSANPGFESRIQFALDFPDYSREELGEIARVFLNKKKYEIEDAALSRILDIAEYFRKQPNFANARTVRNILDQVLMNQNLRTEDTPDDRAVILADVEDYLADEKLDLNKYAEARTIGFV
ncbi:MAG: AAA family ATPase, partial [Oscillospiraceae bacterium]|nr:AAA family ATPase [Oscillospiraceae bacterium]